MFLKQNIDSYSCFCRKENFGFVRDIYAMLFIYLLRMRQQPATQNLNPEVDSLDKTTIIVLRWNKRQIYNLQYRLRTSEP